MKNDDFNTLFALKTEFNKNTQDITVPEALSPENMVAMLKEVKQESPKAEKSNAVIFRRIGAVAASFMLVAVLTFFIRNSVGTNVGLKSAFEGFKNDNLVKLISSNDELENIVNEMFSSDSNQNNDEDKTVTEPTTEKNGLLSIFNEEKETETNPVVSVENAKGEDIDSMVCQAVNSGESDRLSDTVKANGDYLYILTRSNGSQAIKIVRVTPAEDMVQVGMINLGKNILSNVVDECLEIYMQGNTLVALIQRSSFVMSDDEMVAIQSVRALYYNVSNPEAPTKICEQSQEGNFVTAKLVNDKFYLVTCKTLYKDNGAVPFLMINNKEYDPLLGSEEYITAENSKEKAVLFMTASNLNNLGADIPKLAILGCGNNAEVNISGDTIYILRLFASQSTDEKRTEIYSFNCDGSKFTRAGTYSFGGSVLGAPGVNESGHIRLITNEKGKYKALALTSNLEVDSQSKEFEAIANGKVSYIGDKAFIIGKGKTIVVNFAQGGITTKSVDIDCGTGLYNLTDGNILAISSPNNEGNVNISLISSTDSVLATYNFDASQSLAITSDSRSIVQNKDNHMFGLPIIIMDSDGTQRSAYCIFTTESGSILPLGVFTHEANYVGDAATRAVYQNGTLYTVSNEKITAFNVANMEIVNSLSLNE